MPSSTDDNSWDDVYAELGIEAPKPKPASVPEPIAEPEAPPILAEADALPEHEQAAGWAGEALDASTESVAEDMIVQASEGEEEGEESAEGDAGDGTANPERKRRRRRRRRRKGSPGDEAATAGTPEAAVAGEPIAYEGGEEEEEQEALVPAGAIADDAAPSETLRDLIATWNVPSWDDIISGLYRPER